MDEKGDANMKRKATAGKKRNQVLTAIFYAFIFCAFAYTIFTISVDAAFVSPENAQMIIILSALTALTVATVAVVGFHQINELDRKIVILECKIEMLEKENQELADLSKTQRDEVASSDDQ